MLDTQVQQGEKLWKSEAEKTEFDNISGDGIQAIRDVGKLRRMEKYFRQEGFPQTADAVRKRLLELGQQDPMRGGDPSIEKEAREELNSLKSWTAKINALDRDANLSRSAGLPGSLAAPPPRAAAAVKVADAKPSSIKPSSDDAKPSSDSQRDQQPKNKPDSKFGGQVRSGSDYYRKWDQFAEQAVQETEQSDEPGGAAQAKTSGGAAPAKAAPLTGSALTQKILQLNEGLSEKERVWNAEQEKAKGNESFRAHEYTDAVEHYTLSLGFHPHASVYANRAAAYFKLHMHQEVVSDCDSTLSLEPGHLKALVRRAAARMELGQAQQAMLDIEAGLVLQPDNKELAAMHQKAAKALGLNTMKRMAIVEVDDEEEGEEGEQPAPGAAISAPAGGVGATAARGSSGGGSVTSAATNGTGQRRRITVVDEDDDDEDSDVKPGEQQSGAVKADVPAALTPSPAPPAAAAAPQPKAQQATAAAVPSAASAAGRTRIPVVEESDDDEEEEVVVQEAGAPAGRTSAVQLPMPPAVPAQPAPTPAAAPAPTKQQDKAAPTAAKSKQAPVETKTAAAESKKAPRAAAAPTTTTPPVTAPAATATTATAAQTPATPAAPAAPAEPSLSERLEQLQAAAAKCLTAGNHVRATELFTQALALEPDNVALYLSRAQARMKHKDLTGCLADSALAVALDPSDPQAMRQRALVKQQLGLIKAARDDMLVAESLSATSTDKKLKIDIIKERIGLDAEVAAKAKARASKQTRYPGGVTIEEHSDEEEEQGAGVGLARVTKVESGAASQVIQLRKQAAAIKADALARQQAAAAATAAATVPAEATPTPAAPASVNRGSQAAAAPAKEQPKATPKATPKEQPKAAEAPKAAPKVTAEQLKEQAAQKFSSGLKAEAKALWEQAVALEPAASGLALACHVNLALVNLQLDNPTAALQHADAVLKFEPSHEYALTRRMKALKALGRLQEALDTCRELRAKHPLSPMINEEMSELVAALEPAAAAAPRSSAPAPSTSTAAASTAAASSSSKAAASPSPPVTSPQQQQEADRLREAGNQAFKDNDMHGALAAYVKSISIMPSAAAYANQALILLKLNRAAEAEAACRAALTLEPSYVKAQIRLGRSLRQLGRAQEAVDVLELAYQQTPTIEVAADLRAAQEDLKHLNSFIAPTPAATTSSSTVTKVVVVETDSDSDDDQDTLLAHTPSSPPKQQSVGRSQQQSEAGGSDKAQQVAGVRAPSPPAPLPAGSGPTGAKLHQSAAEKAAAAIANLASKQPAPPKNSVDFLNACKLIGDDTEMLGAYVSSVPPTSYPALFKQSLDNACVSHLLKACTQLVKSDPDFVKSMLDELPKVSRFSMVSAMMGKPDKTAVKGVLEQLKAQGVPVGDLPAKYKV